MVSQSQSVESLVRAALECSPSDRSAFLDRACQNSPKVRQLVEERLCAEERAGCSSVDLITRSPTREADPLHGGANFSSIGRFAPGQVLAGRFTVIRFIARGGMGEVYEVEDAFLQGVHVALKMILPEVADNADSSHRFEQEVLLARKLTHPNLCPIYDIARSQDSTSPYIFLTMKLLAGETLSSRLRRTEAIPRDEAITIFRQMTAGLAAIHAAGIIHRDIKPNNVMLDYSGHELCLSIMDFGLARLHEPEATMPTRTLLAGTPGYMAPEILKGQGPSQATDLFALGVLLHQVLTRDRPKVGVLTFTVEPSAVLDRADVPAFCIHSVKELLSAEPQRRCVAFEYLRSMPWLDKLTNQGNPGYASKSQTSKWLFIRELASRFGFRIQRGAWGVTNARVSVAAGLFTIVILASMLLIPAIAERMRGILFSSSQKHIAVLPLDVVGNGPETQALGDGLMDSLAGKLSNLDAQNQSLWVVPATDVRSRKVTDSQSALREFGATIVVKGYFERNNNAVRLRLAIVDPKKTRQIGYVDLETRDGDLASLEDRAIIRIERLLNLSPRQGPYPEIEEHSTHAAYEDYLAGVGYFQRADKPGNLDHAISALESATKADAHFPLALARLAQAYLLKSKLTSDSRWLRLAEETSRRAAELSDQVPSTYVALAQIHASTGNYELAIQEYKHALSLDYNDTGALNGLARSYEDDGRNSEAEPTYIKAASIRPDDWTGYNALGLFYHRTNRQDEAIKQFNRAIELTPDNSWPYINLALAYQDLDRPEFLPAAEAALNKSISINPTFAAYGDLAFLYLRQHRFLESVSASQHALLLNNQNADVWANLTAAYEWLQRAQEARVSRSKTIELFENQIRENPQDAVAHATLAALYAKDESKEKARDSIQTSLALAPSNRFVLTEIASTYETLGNRKEAIKYLRSAIAGGVSRSHLEADPTIQNTLSDPAFKLASDQGSVPALR